MSDLSFEIIWCWWPSSLVVLVLYMSYGFVGSISGYDKIIWFIEQEFNHHFTDTEDGMDRIAVITVQWR